MYILAISPPGEGGSLEIGKSGKYLEEDLIKIRKNREEFLEGEGGEILQAGQNIYPWRIVEHTVPGVAGFVWLKTDWFLERREPKDRSVSLGTRINIKFQH